MKSINYLVLSLLLFASCKEEHSAQTNAKYSVKTVLPEVIDLGKSTHSYPFIIKPFNESDLSFRVNGPLNDFAIQPGDYFKKGQLLLSVNNRDFVVRKQQAEAVLTQANKEFKRIESLYNSGNISGSTYEKAKSDYLVADAAYQTARHALQDTELYAPFSGYIQSVKVQPFEEIKASQSILTLIAVDRLKAEVFLPEQIAQNYINRGGSSNQVSLLFDALPNSPLYPTGVTLSRSTTTNNLSYRMTAVVENSNLKLLGGMSGTLQMHLNAPNQEQTYFLPLAALCHNRQIGNYIWVVKDAKVSRLPVILGKQDGNMMEIKSDLSSDLEVVITRKSFLTDQAIVNPIR